ncbi:MAG: YceD family protein [Chromatiales bacterium]|nr:YceD family protein [Chromatiales bacterium]
MSSRLPEFVDPWRLADREGCITDSIRLADLSRVCGALVSDKGMVDFELRFWRDEKRRARIGGHVKAVLMVQCQRCLESLDIDTDRSLDLAVIEVLEESERIPDECDPILAEEGMVRLQDLIEDELLLAIPQVPMHDEGTCSIDFDDSLQQSWDQSEQNSETATEENPFAVLSQLKSKRDS